MLRKILTAIQPIIISGNLARVVNLTMFKYDVSDNIADNTVFKNTIVYFYVWLAYVTLTNNKGVSRGTWVKLTLHGFSLTVI